MAKTIANLNIKLSAGTATLQRDLQRAGGSVQGFGQQVRSLGSSLAGLAARVTALAGIGSIGASFGWGIKLAADAEQAQVAFEVLLGSATKAQTLLSELRDFAASTPFEFPELRDAGRSLVAFGESAESVPETLRRIGDISSGIGQPIGEIAELYGKARVQGRLFQEDINQLTGRGIPIIQQLAKQFGVADSEVRKLTETGQVSFANLEQAFIDMTSTGGQFAGMMEKQSQTLAGRWSTLKDNVAALALSMGEKLLPAAGKIVDALSGLTQWVGNLDAAFAANAIRIVTFAVSFGAVFLVIPKILAGFRAIVAGLQAIAAGQTIVTALTGPAGWARLAVSVGVAAASVALVSEAFANVTSEADRSQAAVAGVAGAVDTISGQPLDALGESADRATAALTRTREAGQNLLGRTREPIKWRITVNGREQILDSAAALQAVEDAARPGVTLDLRLGEAFRTFGQWLGVVNRETPRATRAVDSLADAVESVADAADRASASTAEIGEAAASAASSLRELPGVEFTDDIARGMAPLREGPQTFEKLRRAAKLFAEQFATPAEKLESELQKIDTLLANRLISEELANRGRAKLRADYEAAMESAKQIEAIERRLESVGAAQWGSAEDLSAINAAQLRLAEMEIRPTVEIPPIDPLRPTVKIPPVEPPEIPGLAEMQARLDAEYGTTVTPTPLPPEMPPIEPPAIPKPVILPPEPPLIPPVAMPTIAAPAVPPPIIPPPILPPPVPGEALVGDVQPRVLPRPPEPAAVATSAPREISDLKAAGERFREMIQLQQEMIRKQDAANASLAEIAKNTKDSGVTVKEVDL